MTIAVPAFRFHLSDLSIDRPRPIHVTNHAPNRAWKADDMESKAVGSESKADSCSARPRPVEEARSWIEAMVADEAVGRGRMAAYHAVGRMISRNESWVRRLLGNQVQRLDAEVYRKVETAHEAWLARVEARAAALLEAAARRRGETDAYLASPDGASAGWAGGSGEPRAAADRPLHPALARGFRP